MKFGIHTKMGTFYTVSRETMCWEELNPTTREVLRSGDLLNSRFPTPTLGERLEIWTPTPTAGVLRCIITSPMVRGEVIREEITKAPHRLHPSAFVQRNGSPAVGPA